MDELELELKEDFLQEAGQLLEDAEQAFLTLEDVEDPTDLINQIFRLAHNLKGTSRAVGFGTVAEFTHEFENLILKIKEGIIPIVDNVVSLLLESNDHLVMMIKMLNMDMDATVDSSDLIIKIQEVLASHSTNDVNQSASPQEKQEKQEKQTTTSVTQDQTSSQQTPPYAQMSLANHDDKEVEDSINNSTTNSIVPPLSTTSKEEIKKAPISDLDNFVMPEGGITEEALEEMLLVNQRQMEREEKEKEAQKVKQQSSSTSKTSETSQAKTTNTKKVAKAPAKDESIRVSLNRVAELNNFVGELVILQTVLQERGDLVVTDELLHKSLRHLGKLSKEIQAISMSLRMVPLKSTMQKMTRIVRDTSKVLNKKVNLILEGEETEIDKTVLEHLSDPLVHIIRNAVDHGLESTEDRVALGKPEKGQIILRAAHEGNSLLITIKDDGNGIDPSIIRSIAIKKGLIKEQDNLTRLEIINLIFAAGFSTKEQVTEVSGRGVGMDVVKNNIEGLSGEIIVESEMGVGSTFYIRLPLTLAIIEGMVVESKEEKYIVPISQITESLRPSKTDIHYITGVGECLDLRGEVIPIFNLQNAFYKRNAAIEITNKTAVVVRNEQMRFAVMVDNIINQQQVVIKQLGKEITDQSGFMGSAILGDGKPAIILDLIELFGRDIKNNKKQRLEQQGNI